MSKILQSSIIMEKLLLLVSFFLLFVPSCEIHADVLELKDQDFISAVNDHPYIMIKFYAPWCAYSNKLSPIYAEVAKRFKQTSQEIQFAQIDATKNQKISKKLSINKYPTIYFFINGTKIHFNGASTLDGMTAWIHKRMFPLITQLKTQEQFYSLSQKNSTSAVFFCNNESQITDFQKLALSDHYVRYYIATDDLLKQQPIGTVKLIRKFDQIATFGQDFSRLERWIFKNSRPVLIPFDSRTYDQIFTQKKKAVVLVNHDNDASLTEAMILEAKSYVGNFLFVELKNNNQYFQKFSSQIKIKAQRSFVVLIDPLKSQKFIQSELATPASIKSFMKRYKSRELKVSRLYDAYQFQEQTVDASEQL